MKQRLGETTVDETPERELLGFRALVTGGTRGIGAAIAATLARRGANVVISARAPADELPDGVQLVLADASTTEGAKHLAAEAEVLLDEVGHPRQQRRWRRPVPGRDRHHPGQRMGGRTGGQSALRRAARPAAVAGDARSRPGRRRAHLLEQLGQATATAQFAAVVSAARQFASFG